MNRRFGAADFDFRCLAVLCVACRQYPRDDAYATHLIRQARSDFLNGIPLHASARISRREFLAWRGKSDSMAAPVADAHGFLGLRGMYNLGNTYGRALRFVGV